MLNRISYLMIFLTVNSIAQKYGNFELNAGYGFYDAFKIGMLYHFKNHIGLGGSAGFDNYFLNKEKYTSTSIEFVMAIFRNLKTSNKNNHIWIHNRIYFWCLEDPFYKFRVIAYNPCFVYRFDLSKKIYIS